jgi:hypothetical protein
MEAVIDNPNFMKRKFQKIKKLSRKQKTKKKKSTKVEVELKREEKLIKLLKKILIRKLN